MSENGGAKSRLEEIEDGFARSSAEEDFAAYRIAMAASVAVLTNRVGAAQVTIENLADRLARLELAVHGREQEASVNQQALERQTRFSAMQLAIQARGPGAVADDVIDAAEAFLVWLRSMPSGT